ncbi:MAG: hypothetical protein NTX05_07780 [Fusobacteria bacterium]|nr:hypothetical protein [Fusobacteriota bacterium]
MTVIKFDDVKPIKPVFGIKVPSVVYKILAHVSENKFDECLKQALCIRKNRLIHVEFVDLQPNQKSMIIVIFDHIVKGGKPKFDVPTKDGFFDFPVYDLNFNLEVDIEKLILVSQKKK